MLKPDCTDAHAYLDLRCLQIVSAFLVRFASYRWLCIKWGMDTYRGGYSEKECILKERNFAALGALSFLLEKMR